MHPAIKKAVCEATANEKDRAWLTKIRPYWGHYYHFHIRIACPKGSTNCEAQPSVRDRRRLRRGAHALARADQEPAEARAPGPREAADHARSAAGRLPHGAGGNEPAPAAPPKAAKQAKSVPKKAAAKKAADVK